MARKEPSPFDRLRDWQSARGYTVRELSRLLGCSDTALHAILKDRTPPRTLRIAQSIRDVAGIPVDAWPKIDPETGDVQN